MSPDRGKSWCLPYRICRRIDIRTGKRPAVAIRGAAIPVEMVGAGAGPVVALCFTTPSISAPTRF